KRDGDEMVNAKFFKQQGLFLKGSKQPDVVLFGVKYQPWMWPESDQHRFPVFFISNGPDAREHLLVAQVHPVKGAQCDYCVIDCRKMVYPFINLHSFQL